MAKFDLNDARQQTMGFTTLKSGIYPARIIHVVDIGYIAFTATDNPRHSVAITFQLSTGQLLSKEMAISDHPSATLVKIVDALTHDVDDLADLIGQKLVLEIEQKGEWPKIIGYESIEYYDNPDITFPDIEFVTLLPTDDEPIDIKANLTVIRTLPKQISSRLLRATPKKAG